MSNKWYWILILNLGNAYSLSVESQIQTIMYILICNLPSDLCEDWSRSLMVLSRLFHWLWHHPRRGPARRWPVTDVVVPMLDQRWTGRRHCLGGDEWLAQGCVWIAYEHRIALVAEKYYKLHSYPTEGLISNSCCNTLSLLQNTCFHVFIYDMHVEPIDVYVVMNLRRCHWISNQY